MGQSTVETENDVLLTTISLVISQKGYQSVSTQIEGTALNIYYENRVQRFEPRAIIDIIKTIGEVSLPNGIESINVITQRNQIPIIATSFDFADFKDWQSETSNLTDFISKIEVVQTEKRPAKSAKAKRINNGNYRFEIELNPQIGLGLGGAPDPVLHRLFLLPTLNTYLWKGALLKAELVLPITSEFNIIDENFVRPGVVSFAQTVKLPKQIWLQGTIGYFSKNRYGGHLSVANFLFNGAVTLTGNVGYTGYASFPKKLGLETAVKGFEYASVDYLDYMLGANYWFKDWNTQVKIEHGRVLFERNLTKLTVLQRFNEVDIGFFAQQSQRGNNYGMQLNLPIFPKKYWKPKRFSIRPANTLNYNYQATQATVTTYETGWSILDIHRQLNPSFIKSQLSIPKRWGPNQSN